MNRYRASSAVCAVLFLCLSVCVTSPQRAFGEDWGGSSQGEDTEMTVAVADSTNLDDGFDWYAEATLDPEDWYYYSVGLEAAVSSSNSDGATWGGSQQDIEAMDAYVEDTAPLFPGVTYYITSSSYVCDNESYGGPSSEPLPECDWDFTMYASFIAGVPSIASISPSSDAVGNSGQITLQGQYLGDPFGGGFTSAAMIGSGVNLSNGTSSSDATTYTLNYSIDQDAQTGTQYLTLTNPFGTSNQVAFTVGDATPVIAGIDPSTWPAGQTTQVTISGEYFGTNAPTLTFSDPSISYTLSSYNDTQIVANVTVPPTDSGENVNVSVTATGYNGNSFYPAPAASSGTSNQIQVLIGPGAASAPCPTTITIGSTTRFSLPNSTLPTPPNFSGIGIVAAMIAGPATGNYYNANITESVATNSQATTCNTGSASSKYCHGSSTFQVGSGQTEFGKAFDAVPNQFYDNHGIYAGGNLLQTFGQSSCIIVCSQSYSCGGNVIGNFTITFSLKPDTVNGYAVTQVTATKQ